MKSQILLLLFTSLVVSKKLQPCTTPNNEKSYCTSLFSCPSLMTLIGSLEPSAIEFVKNSICFSCSTDDVMVCCGSSQNNFPLQMSNDTEIIVTSKILKIITVKRNVISTTPTKKKIVNAEPNKDYVKRTLLPTRRYCGYQHTDDRFYEDTVTAFDEYPWLVSIASSLRDDRPGYLVGDRCNGVLISKRYILTYSYCAHHALKVKLGQYNTHENKSCIENPTFKECTDQPIEIRVEEKIRDGKKSNGPYDFALLRLAEPVQFTDFVRPICLPMVEDERPKDLQSIIFSGWGVENETAAIVKKRLVYDIVDDEVCYKHEKYIRGNVKHAQVSFICAMAQKNNTDLGCYGDYGGPFMYSRKHQWFVEGTSIGVFSCDNTTPVTGIRITKKTINWILSSIRP